MKDLPRRVVLHRALHMLTGVALLPLVARRAAADSCVDPSSESLRTTLNYLEVSPHPEQACSSCGFFTAGTAPCGNCQIMSGPVSATAHCDSWAPKS